jgi:hypothetical protein
VLVALTAGFGDGEVEVWWGYDEHDALVCAQIDCLPSWQLEPPPPGAGPWPALRPPTGHERALLLPTALGGELIPENTVPVPPAAHRALAAAHRRMISLLLAGHAIDASVVPQYGPGGSPVPRRIRVSVRGTRAFDEVIDVHPGPSANQR